MLDINPKLLPSSIEFHSTHNSSKKHIPTQDNNKSNIKFKDTLKQLVQPSTLLTIAGTIALTQGFEKVLHALVSDSKHDDNDENIQIFSKEYFKDLGIYASQIVFNIQTWTILSDLMPEIKFNTKSLISIKPSLTLRNTNGNISKVFKKHLTGSKQLWKFIGLLTASYTGIQLATDWIQSHILPSNKLLYNTVTVLSVGTKVLTMFLCDSFINNKPISLMAFTQSLTEVCGCCGNPRLLCPQIAPVITDIYKSLNEQDNITKNVLDLRQNGLSYI